LLAQLIRAQGEDAAARSLLEEGLAAAWAEGRAISLEQAVGYALDGETAA
jgi:hypothetical protein